MLGSQIFSYINWVDILCIVILIRVVFIAIRRGLVDEFFKTMGVFLSLVLGLQFAPILGGVISNKTPLPLESAKTIIFFLIITITLLLFKFIRSGFTFIFKVETISSVNRTGAFLMGVLRSFLSACLVMVFFTFSSIDYLHASAKDSFIYPNIMDGARVVYNISYAVLNKFMPNLEKNGEMEEV